MRRMSKRPGTAQNRHSASNTYRFFVAPQAITGDAVVIDDAAMVHQWTTVLRLQAGDVVTLLPDNGDALTVRLDHLDRRTVRGTVESRIDAGNEPRTQITLYVALLRAERFAWVLQKGTELGVSAFVPLLCERNEADERSISAAKHERWQRIIREAAEQAFRGRLPVLQPLQPFATACTMVAHPAVFLWEGAGGRSLRTVAAPSPHWAVFSGPVGGWSQAEQQQAHDAGLLVTTLGPRILRAETAPVVAATALLLTLGDLE